MKKIKCTAFLLALLMSLSACATKGADEEETAVTTKSTQQTTTATTEAVADTPSIELSVTTHPNAEQLAKMDMMFPAALMYSYDGTANVPKYTVQPGLSNIVNLNQYIYGTDAQGDQYFATDLSDGSIEYIEKNGFVVLDNRSYNEYYSMYEQNRYDFVPSFITTDSALHTFHLMYDYVLKDVERIKLMDTLKALTTNMAEYSHRQYLELKSTEFENAALRNMAYFCVGGRLLDGDFPIWEEVKDLVEQELALIGASAGIFESPLVNYGQNHANFTEIYEVDYSQFIPRGHYTQSEELEKYFRATMWYGQITMRSAYEDEVRSALLMTSALNAVENLSYWQIIFQTINFFVGECDDITYVDYIDTLGEIYGGDIGNLAAITDESKFKKAFEAIKQLPPPSINSIPVYDESLQPDRDKAITGFRFLGQRFTIDASIFQRLIERETKGRYLPAALDIPAAFGSAEAYNILREEYEVDSYPDYAGNLGDVKEYVEGLDSTVWTSNLYWSWINMLRPLATNSDRQGYPMFMQNTAWKRKELNTFVASWTELKHDTLLYSKSPMAEKGGGGPDEPPPDDRGYVEPNPEVFGRLNALVEQTRDGLKQIGLMTDDAEKGLSILSDLSARLTTIAEKELANTPLSDDDYDFIRFYGGELEHIWDTAKKDEMEARKAEYGDENKETYQYFHPDAIVADVATDPNGMVLEEATGYAKPIVVAFPRDGEVVLGMGVVYSHYEFTVGLSERMTDDQWHEILRSARVPMPDAPTMPSLANWKLTYTFLE